MTCTLRPVIVYCYCTSRHKIKSYMFTSIMRLAKKDKLILKNLHGVKMPSYADISLKTGLPESTVRYRFEDWKKWS